MTINHHPSDFIVLAYASGSLATPLALVVGAHVDNCETCRETLELSESLGGLYLESAPPEDVDPAALARVLSRLDTPAATAAVKTSPTDLALDLPLSLRGHTIGRQRWLIPGIWVRRIVKGGAHGTRAYLLGAAAGKTLPHHGHSGIELTQVLKGELYDGNVRYGVGDFLEADGGEEHHPRAGATGECICAVASEGVPRGLSGLLIRAFV